MNKMKILSRYVFTLLFCIPVISVNAQNKSEIKPLKVGDTVPELLFNNMVNYQSKTAKLSDFKGKAVILDFWAIWCVPCIASFPKLEKFQKAFDDELKILLLSRHDENGIRNFYRDKALTLPTAFYEKTKDSLIYNMFPHHEIPHYIWIDKTKKIYAITDGTQVTEENLNRFLQEQESTLIMKNDSVKFGNYNGNVLDSIYRNQHGTNVISKNDKILYQSMLMKYDSRLTPVELRGNEDERFKYYSMQNLPATKMLQFALGFYSSKDNWRFFLDFKDTTFIPPSVNSSPIEKDKWMQNRTYTYRIILNKADSIYLQRTMKRDIEWAFGLKTYKKKIKVPYLILRSIADPSKLTPKSKDSSSINYSIYNINLKNRPMSDLLFALHRFRVGKNLITKQQQDIHIIDRTNINGNIDIDINGIEITNLDDLNMELKKNGLELVKKVGKQDMIVITDK